MPFAVSHRFVRRSSLLCATVLPTLLAGCHRNRFPSYPESYREFAYVSDAAANTVAVLDLVYLREDRTLAVGKDPVALAASPTRKEVYVANAGSDSVSVINAEQNRVDATIGVHSRPVFVEVSPDGRRAYVPNAGANTVSVIDLDSRREIGTAATGEGPAVARVSPDNRTLIVTNRTAGSLSVYSIHADDPVHPLTLRASFDNCPGASDAVIEADAPQFPTFGSKAFVACSGGHQVLDVWLAAAPDSWRGKQNPELTHDQKLALLDVGKSPVHLALKPDNGEVFSTNADDNSISEISTWTNEVEGTYVIGSKPSRAVINKDGSLLWVTNSGADSASLYSIADGRMVTGVRTGAAPDALAFSSDEHILLVADKGSADIAVIRTQANAQPTLVTMLPAGPQPTDIVIKSFTLKP